MIKINCELPLTMMDKNIELNDYDFVLFHLYEDSVTYKEYYLNLRKTHPEREMILDCSAYEYFIKKQSLPIEKYYKVILELQPDYYIMPDTLMDQNKTLDDSLKFRDYISKQSQQPKGEPMYVVQGNSMLEMAGSIMLYHKWDVKNIAIPFHNSFFKEVPNYYIENRWRLKLGRLTEDMKYALGRIEMVNEFKCMLQFFNRVHLLGSHFPLEKPWYPSNIIYSMDTGCPVKAGYMGIDILNCCEKPDIVIDDFFRTVFTEEQKKLVIDNIKQFKLF